MLQLDVSVSYPLAFLAGLLSFLSPCVLPVVPSYVTFVSGVTVGELREGNVWRARRKAALHAVFFGVGFGLVFMTLGAAATAAGRSLTQALPWITRAGGVVVILFALWLLGPLRRAPGFDVLGREKRIHPATKPAGLFGSLLVGVAFGAGWTPCIGPVLASILLYAGLEHTMVEGTLLLATYGFGLAVPFVGAAVAFNWFIASMAHLQTWLPWLERLAGTLLLVIGLLMVSGHFIALNAYLADLGQLFYLDTP